MSQTYPILCLYSNEKGIKRCRSKHKNLYAQRNIANYSGVISTTVIKPEKNRIKNIDYNHYGLKAEKSPTDE